MLDISQRLLIQFVTIVWYCSHGKRSKTALRACSSSGLEKVSSLRLVFLLSSDGTLRMWSHQLVRVRARILPNRVFFDAEAARVSNLHIRVEMALKFCSISVSLVAKSPSVFVICESIRDIQFVIEGDLRDLRFKVHKFRKESIEFFICCTSRGGAQTIEVGTRAIRRTKIRRSKLHG